MTEQMIVEAWDRGRDVRDVMRPLAVLGACEPHAGVSDLARLPVGKRDNKLLQLRKATFGRILRGSSFCDECRMGLSFELDIDAIVRPEATAVAASTEFVSNGMQVRIRALDTLDLELADRCDSVEQASALLIGRCVVSVTDPSGNPVTEPYPQWLIEEVAEQLSEVDPMVEIPVELQCPRCANEWVSPLDFGTFFWTELAASAERLMYDVSRLALCFGWSEQDILRMGPARRRQYMALSERR